MLLQTPNELGKQCSKRPLTRQVFIAHPRCRWLGSTGVRHLRESSATAELDGEAPLHTSASLRLASIAPPCSTDEIRVPRHRHGHSLLPQARTHLHIMELMNSSCDAASQHFRSTRTSCSYDHRIPCPISTITASCRHCCLRVT
jgi:hypothetical protein